jgi:hypothetical protein
MHIVSIHGMEQNLLWWWRHIFAGFPHFTKGYVKKSATLGCTYFGTVTARGHLGVTWRIPSQSSKAGVVAVWKDRNAETSHLLTFKLGHEFFKLWILKWHCRNNSSCVLESSEHPFNLRRLYPFKIICAKFKKYEEYLELCLGGGGTLTGKPVRL